MPFELSVRGAKRVSAGIWRAAVDPAHVRLLGQTSLSLGEVSVVLLTKEPKYDNEDSLLALDPSWVKLLNVGATDAAVFILGSSDEIPNLGHRRLAETDEEGDDLFLQKLTPELRPLAGMLLESVRKQFSGSLKFHPRSEKFVETPDNFWTVRIQRRDKSLRITVRGVPSSFSPTGLIDLKPDMGSYSSFKVSTLEQVAEAVEVIRQASRK